MKINYLIALLLIAELSCAQNIKAPASHSNLKQAGNGVVIEVDGKQANDVEYLKPYLLDSVKGQIQGTKTGLYFDFHDVELKGKLFFGFIPQGDSKYPHPVYFNRSAEILSGRSTINIAYLLRGRYDMVGWEKSGKGTLGYRVVTSSGAILYDGSVSFKGTGPFEVDNSIVEGPFVNLLMTDGATISFDTNHKLKASVKTIFKAFEFDQAKDYLKYSVGFSWVI